MMFGMMERRSSINFESRNVLAAEEAMMMRPGYGSGTTANVAIIEANRVVVANAGDCRAVLCRAGTAIELSVDHKPQDADERRYVCVMTLVTISLSWFSLSHPL